MRLLFAGYRIQDCIQECIQAQTLWEFVRLWIYDEKKIRPKFHFLTMIEIKTGGGGEGVYSGLQVTGMIEGFLGLKFLTWDQAQFYVWETLKLGLISG